ncbi:hypothetical protein RFI_04672 [Reticulomyxa filosa]|uniref:Uncharacterized protein n=1 Tax=Reticulomyxa filosa TaxID=46433 RepID=X6P4C3_RETFI|nr:hypothetical protein RFI_04672 [Reticulomyxa filosa]|eukprot:ETO32447.1 hypothetical protein RFI_04672 [Reticulomyxa filosa]
MYKYHKFVELIKDLFYILILRETFNNKIRNLAQITTQKRKKFQMSTETMYRLVLLAKAKAKKKEEEENRARTNARNAAPASKQLQRNKTTNLNEAALSHLEMTPEEKVAKRLSVTYKADVPPLHVRSYSLPKSHNGPHANNDKQQLNNPTQNGDNATDSKNNPNKTDAPTGDEEDVSQREVCIALHCFFVVVFFLTVFLLYCHVRHLAKPPPSKYCVSDSCLHVACSKRVHIVTEMDLIRERKITMKMALVETITYTYIHTYIHIYWSFFISSKMIFVLIINHYCAISPPIFFTFNAVFFFFLKKKKKIYIILYVPILEYQKKAFVAGQGGVFGESQGHHTKGSVVTVQSYSSSFGSSLNGGHGGGGHSAQSTSASNGVANGNNGIGIAGVSPPKLDGIGEMGDSSSGFADLSWEKQNSLHNGDIDQQISGEKWNLMQLPLDEEKETDFVGSGSSENILAGTHANNTSLASVSSKSSFKKKSKRSKHNKNVNAPTLTMAESASSQRYPDDVKSDPPNAAHLSVQLEAEPESSLHTHNVVHSVSNDPSVDLTQQITARPIDGDVKSDDPASEPKLTLQPNVPLSNDAKRLSTPSIQQQQESRQSSWWNCLCCCGRNSEDNGDKVRVGSSPTTPELTDHGIDSPKNDKTTKSQTQTQTQTQMQMQMQTQTQTQMQAQIQTQTQTQVHAQSQVQMQLQQQAQQQQQTQPPLQPLELTEQTYTQTHTPQDSHQSTYSNMSQLVRNSIELPKPPKHATSRLLRA